jgi:hypothetical protein
MAARGILIRAAVAAFLLAVLWCFTPPEPGFRLCGFYWLTGRPCPLCGLTRAMFALAKGHWSQAIRYNALSPLAFAMLAGLFWNRPIRSRLWMPAAAAFAVYGICRIVLPWA